MEEYVYIDGKKYKRGYTTGSCAAGAAKAATYMLLTKQKIEKINIDTPKGIPLTLNIHNIKFNNDYVECSVEKDGGDDIDATHTMHIHARVEFIEKQDKQKILICGRSEEHTSELQSRFDLVCRLLLEKKKIKFIKR